MYYILRTQPYNIVQVPPDVMTYLPNSNMSLPNLNFFRQKIDGRCTEYHLNPDLICQTRMRVNQSCLAVGSPNARHYFHTIQQRIQKINELLKTKMHKSDVKYMIKCMDTTYLRIGHRNESDKVFLTLQLVRIEKQNVAHNFVGSTFSGTNPRNEFQEYRSSEVLVSEADVVIEKNVQSGRDEIELASVNTYVIPGNGVFSSMKQTNAFQDHIFEGQGFATMLICIFFFIFGYFELQMSLICMTETTAKILIVQGFSNFCSTEQEGNIHLMSQTYEIENEIYGTNSTFTRNTLPKYISIFFEPFLHIETQSQHETTPLSICDHAWNQMQKWMKNEKLLKFETRH